MNPKTINVAERQKAATNGQLHKSALTLLTIALAGNPNAGKTTLFNALTGLRQKVANYSGVTVERKEGIWRLDGSEKAARLIDLPGHFTVLTRLL
ncbi:MAG: FeoB small GTPase domain-containing protein [Nocardioidaceae bacterium]